MICIQLICIICMYNDRSSKSTIKQKQMSRSKKKIFACCHSEPQQQMINDSIVDTFIVAFSRGFAVINAYTSQILITSQSPYKGAAFISTLNNSNIMAIIPNEKDFVHIWDLKKKCILFGISLLNQDVITGLVLRPDCVIVISILSFSIFNLYDRNQLSSRVTSANPSGAFDIPPSFSSELAAILSKNPGEFQFFSLNEPSKTFPSIKAFPKGIDVLRFNPNGNIVAVASKSNTKIRIYRAPIGDEIIQLKLPINEEGAVDVRFDAFDSLAFVVTPSNLLYFYSLEGIDITKSVNEPHQLKYVTWFNLPKRKNFYASFASQLNTIEIVTEDCLHIVLSYDAATKKIDVEKEFQMALTVK